MSKAEVLEILARSNSFVTPDHVWLGLKPRPDRRSVYSYLLRVETPRSARNRAQSTALEPDVPIDPAQVFSFPEHLVFDSGAASTLWVGSPERAKTGWRGFGTITRACSQGISSKPSPSRMRWRVSPRLPNC